MHSSVNILCFHSRGQHLCKFIGTKESLYIRKEFNSHRTGLNTNMAAVSLFLAAMTSCETHNKRGKYSEILFSVNEEVLTRTDTEII